MIDSTVVEALRKAEQILCASHVSPDGDAYGSLLGMGWLLRHLGKQPVLAMHDKIPRDFQTLPGIGEVIAPGAIGSQYDLIIVLDTSSLDRVGSVYQPQRHSQIPILVIDHHITNTYFGQINWVMPACAATCQMLVYLADALAVPLTGALAECLLTGIVTDTLCFRTSNTDAQVLEAALRLMRGGADLTAITQRTLNQRSFGLFKLWGMVLQHTRLEDGVIWTTVSRNEMRRAGNITNDGQLSSTLITAVEADMSATFAEKVDDQGRSVVECSFRARPGYNVAVVALSFGGGGHPAASGCTLPGTLSEVTALVVPALKLARQQQTSALLANTILGATDARATA
jgi:bifunctional oligoribonuclease and PAP phosphatase NrnA